MPSQRTDWRAPTIAIVAIVTAFRLLALAVSDADIFVDEAQYWLWGQNLDFGYYSKPPLAAWVIRATTELAGSNSPFWLRFPVPWFHAATALILASIAAHQFGRLPAIWVAASYITFPIVAVGSTLISTDTILAPFFAAGLLFYLKLVETNRTRDAVLAGAMIGLAFMAKYAAVYFVIGAMTAAVVSPAFRVAPRHVLAFVIAFLIVISPNIIWNLTHDLTTVQHTLDNVDWVRDGSNNRGINLRPFAEFIASQFIAVGPVIFVTLFILLRKSSNPKTRALLAFSLPIIALVSIQALLSKAYGNWAFTAYLAGTIAVIPWLLVHARKWLYAGMVFNIAFSLILAAVTTFGDDITLGQKQPILTRYMGRDELSQQIIALAAQQNITTIVASNRDVLADLFYTGVDAELQVYSVASVKRPKHYYQQLFSFPPDTPDTQEQILFITATAPLICNGAKIAPLAKLDTKTGVYRRKNFRAYIVQPDCFAVLK